MVGILRRSCASCSFVAKMSRFVSISDDNLLAVTLSSSLSYDVEFQFGNIIAVVTHPFCPSSPPSSPPYTASAVCHQAPGRAGRLRELAGEARESGGSKSQLRLSPTVLPSLFNSFKHAFQHDGDSAIVRTFTTMTLLYRVFAVFATRDSETARRGARLLSLI